MMKEYEERIREITNCPPEKETIHWISMIQASINDCAGLLGLPENPQPQEFYREIVELALPSKKAPEWAEVMGRDLSALIIEAENSLERFEGFERGLQEVGSQLDTMGRNLLIVGSDLKGLQRKVNYIDQSIEADHDYVKGYRKAVKDIHNAARRRS